MRTRKDFFLLIYSFKASISNTSNSLLLEKFLIHLIKDLNLKYYLSEIFI